VLRNGTKISLLIRSHYPAVREYLIERTVPNPPIVRNSTGAVTRHTPADVVPKVEIFGQHEIEVKEGLINKYRIAVESGPNYQHLLPSVAGHVVRFGKPPHLHASLTRPSWCL